jgi:hypothetical protein
MAYQTGQFTDPVDLLQKLITFLQSNGWTVNMNQIVGSHCRAHIQNADVCINLFAAVGNASGYNPWAFNLYTSPSVSSGALHLYASSGYDSGAAWNNQPGKILGYNSSNAIGSAMKLIASGSNTFHFFLNGNNVTVVAERVSGFWQHLGWGSIQKAGSYTGGHFFFATCPGYRVYASESDASAKVPMGHGTTQGYSYMSSGFVRADVDSYVDRWINISDSGTQTYFYGTTGRNAYSSGNGGVTPPNSIAGNNGISERSTSSVTGQISLLPVRIFAVRDTSPGGCSLLGTVPGIFDCQHGYSAGTIISMGADNYVLFPNFAVQKVV